MSSIIFQPLLHDPLGWKQSNSTYADTYVWKTLRANKKANLSKYGQKHQKEAKKQEKLEEINRQETISQIISKNKSPTPVLPRSAVKTPPVVVEQLMTLPVEYKQRTPSANRENTCGSRTSLRLSTPAEENGRAATSTDVRQTPPKEEKEKSLITDPNNDNSRHWLTYPNPKTPQYLVDIKKRLGHIKVPFVRPASSTISHQQSNEQSEVVKKPTTTTDADQRHFFDFNLPQTPDELRAARHRIAKYRYNPALDNFPPRPQTCPVNIDENEQILPPPATSSDESAEVKEDAWTNDEENKPVDQEASTVVIQCVDCEGMPNEYVQAVETASAAQEDYYKTLQLNNEKRSDSTTFRRPSTSNDNQKESFIAYRNQQHQSTPPNNNNSTLSRQNEFNSWVRSATGKEREAALKILQDVLNQPIMGYDFPKKSNKQTPPSLRASSASRKLGRTRNVHRRIPCEICEKQLIKHHIWTLNQSDSTVCLHQAQGIKPPIIQIRT